VKSLKQRKQRSKDLGHQDCGDASQKKQEEEQEEKR
jgi:hypothetical protein